MWTAEFFWQFLFLLPCKYKQDKRNITLVITVALAGMDLMNIIATQILVVGQWKKTDQVQLFRLYKPKKQELLSLHIILLLN